MLKKILISILMGILLVCGLFGFLFLNHLKLSKQNEQIEYSEKKQEIEVKKEVEEDLYKDIPFGEGVPVPEEQLVYEEEIKYNGTLLEEYENNNIFTQIRVHNQSVDFSNYSFFVEEEMNDESDLWIYDSPETKQNTASLIMNQRFEISKFRRDFNLETEEIVYWLYITQNENQGWIIMKKTDKPIEYLYENGYWEPYAVFFPHDPYRNIYHIRNVDGYCLSETTLSVYNQPVYRQAECELIKPGDKGYKSLKITRVISEEDRVKYKKEKNWYFVESDELKGWCEGSDQFSSGRGGGYYKYPDSVIIDYYCLGL